MANNKRWTLAQTAEREFWSHYKYNDSVKQAHQIYLECLTKHRRISKDAKILDIGCGPHGLIRSFPLGKKYGLDPLMNYYISTFSMPKNITWVNGQGENLPWPNETFDIITIVNVLDHAEDPSKVLVEARRCLKKSGILFIVLNVYPSTFVPFRKFRELIGFGDTCHPHTFTIDNVQKLLNNYFAKTWAEVTTANHIRIEKQANIRNFSKKALDMLKKGQLFSLANKVFNVLEPRQGEAMFVCEK